MPCLDDTQLTDEEREARRNQGWLCFCFPYYCNRFFCVPFCCLITFILLRFVGHLSDAWLRTHIQQDYLHDDWFAVFYDELLFWLLEKILPVLCLLLLVFFVGWWIKHRFFTPAAAA